MVHLAAEVAVLSSIIPVRLNQPVVVIYVGCLTRVRDILNELGLVVDSQKGDANHYHLLHPLGGEACRELNRRLRGLGQAYEYCGKRNTHQEER